MTRGSHIVDFQQWLGLPACPQHAAQIELACLWPSVTGRRGAAGRRQRHPITKMGRALAGYSLLAVAVGISGAASVPLNNTSHAAPAGPWGPDVSHYQNTVAWTKVKAAGAGFAIAKATEGTTYVDGKFKTNQAAMKTAGFAVRGYYHYGHPGSSATTQAKHFLSTVGSLLPGDFLVLDLETGSASATPAARAGVNGSHVGSHTPASVAKWANDFVTAVTSMSRLNPKRVWVYTGKWFWDPQAGGGASLPNSFFAHPLWVSGYVSKPPMPKGWSTYTMWQYTDKKQTPGITTAHDASVFKGTQAQLEALVRT